MRQIVLDTETTGLDPQNGHRIIEIGCVEMVNRRLTGKHFHQYINPQRQVDAGAFEVHGISDMFLADKPVFAQIAQDFIDFISGAELIIHNAPFDLGFIDHELRLDGQRFSAVEKLCSVIDTLVMARNKHPGQKNSLDALCKRYAVDNSQRDLHGALLDAEILADVYLLMTGGQTSLVLGGEDSQGSAGNSNTFTPLQSDRQSLPVVRANTDELAAHQDYLQALDKASDSGCVWLKTEIEAAPN